MGFCQQVVDYGSCSNQEVDVNRKNSSTEFIQWMMDANTEPSIIATMMKWLANTSSDI